MAEHHHHHSHGHHGHGDELGAGGAKLNSSCRNHLGYLAAALPWRENETILDYGCGNGSAAIDIFLPIAQANKSQLYAVDMDGDSINTAKTKYPDHATMFYQGNIVSSEEKWPLDHVKFDKIPCNHVLQNVEKIDTFLEKTLGILNKGGELGAVLIFNKFMDLAKFLPEFPVYGKDLNSKFPSVASWAPNAEAAKEHLTRLIPQKGYELVEIKLEEHLDNFTGINKLADIALTILGNHGVASEANVVSRMTPEEKENLRQFITNKFTDIFQVPADVESFEFHAKSVRFVARKL